MSERQRFYILLALFVLSLVLVWLVTSSYGQSASNLLG